MDRWVRLQGTRSIEPRERRFGPLRDGLRDGLEAYWLHCIAGWIDSRDRRCCRSHPAQAWEEGSDVPARQSHGRSTAPGSSPFSIGCHRAHGSDPHGAPRGDNRSVARVLVAGCSKRRLGIRDKKKTPSFGWNGKRKGRIEDNRNRSRALLSWLSILLLARQPVSELTVVQ